MTQTEEEAKKYKKEYYQKTREKRLKQAKEYRSTHKYKLKKYFNEHQYDKYGFKGGLEIKKGEFVVSFE